MDSRPLFLCTTLVVVLFIVDLVEFSGPSEFLPFSFWPISPPFSSQNPPPNLSYSSSNEDFNNCYFSSSSSLILVNFYLFSGVCLQCFMNYTPSFHTFSGGGFIRIFWSPQFFLNFLGSSILKKYDRVFQNFIPSFMCRILQISYLIFLATFRRFLSIFEKR